MLNKDRKSTIIKQFAKSDSDSGSCEVQVALLSERIRQIAGHLKTFPKDKHSRLGLVKLVGRRRALFNYLKRKNLDGYKVLMKQLKEGDFI
jgi:small subunit ribosomal protein S15